MVIHRPDQTWIHIRFRLQVQRISLVTGYLFVLSVGLILTMIVEGLLIWCRIFWILGILLLLSHSSRLLCLHSDGALLLQHPSSRWSAMQEYYAIIIMIVGIYLALIFTNLAAENLLQSRPEERTFASVENIQISWTNQSMLEMYYFYSPDDSNCYIQSLQCSANSTEILCKFQLSYG